jgi:hypothetical protein
VVAISIGALGTADGAALAQDSGGWIQDVITGCAVWSVDPPRDDEGVSWSGACDNDKASGLGVLVWWNSAGLQGRYVGEMASGKLNGEGRLFLREAETSRFNSYVGYFADNAPVGTGFLTTADGERFVGELLDGLRHLRGVILTRDGAVLRGEFLDGEGVGTLFVDYTTEEGERYAGQARNGERNGFGTLVATDGDSYAGHFRAGVPDGPGLYEGVNGERFMGDFENGKPNGFGTAIDADGNVVQGLFVDGEPDGTVVVTEPDGTQSVTTWTAGDVK